METRLETFGRLEVLACAGIDASIVQRSAAKDRCVKGGCEQTLRRCTGRATGRGATGCGAVQVTTLENEASHQKEGERWVVGINENKAITHLYHNHEVTTK